MGFYGNITDTSKTTFSFDLIYSTRVAMDLAADEDGVFLGRYVLVDYDEAPIKGYAKREGFTIIDFYSSPGFAPASKITGRDGYVYECLNPIDNDKSIFYKYDEGRGVYSELGEDKTPYYESYELDIKKYGRGYDSTVWVKRFDPEIQKYKYAMVAELNAVVPTLHLVANPPNQTPVAPYFDRDTTNIDYYLHMPSEFSTRIKKLPVDTVSGQMRSDETVKFTSGKWVAGPDGYNVWQENPVVSQQGDIYYNRAGFDPALRTYSDGRCEYYLTDDQGNRLLDDNGNPKKAVADYSVNQIGFDFGRSGKYYGGSPDMGIYKDGTPADDIFDWFIRLPSIGNSICMMWDKMYGYRDDDKRHLNNSLTYNDSSDNLVTYDQNTFIGVINTFRDLVGYHYVPIGGIHTEGAMTYDADLEAEVSLEYDNGISPQTTSYKALNCIFYDENKNYYAYAYNPNYGTPVTPDFASNNIYYYKDDNGLFHVANSEAYQAVDANGNPIENLQEYYMATPRWILRNIGDAIDNNLYSFIGNIHQMLGTNTGDIRDMNSVQGAINAMKDVISNINTNLIPGRLIHTNNNGVIETTETSFPSADWDKDELLAGDGTWVSRFASVKVRENSTNSNRKIPKVVAFETTGETTGNAPAKLLNQMAELVSDNQRTQEGTTLVYKQEHDPNTLIFATRDKWIKLHPDTVDDSIEFEHTQSELVNRLSYQDYATLEENAIEGPAADVNSNVNTANFKANEDGTELTIISDSDIALLYADTEYDSNDNRLTIPYIVVDNAGHVVSAGTKNYNIPNSFKKISTSTIEDANENESLDQAGISIAEEINDTLHLSSRNRWIDIATETTNNNEGAEEDTITWSHRLVPALSENITLNGDRRTLDTEIPTVYRFGLEANKDIETLNKVNGNEPANSFNIPYIEIDKAGHVVAAETHTVEIPEGYTTIKVGSASSEIVDAGAKEATLVADNLTEQLTIKPSNKWIKMSGENTDGADEISIGHIVSAIASTTQKEDLDNTKKDEFTTQVVTWDEAGHITGQDVKTWVLPDSIHDIKVIATSTNTLDTEVVGGTIVADTSFDEVVLQPYNKWIRLNANENTDAISFGHLVQEIQTETPSTDLNTEGTFKTEEYTYDEAGHIRSKATRTLTLPYGYKTIKVLNSNAENSISTNSGEIVAANQVDSYIIASGNKWIEMAAADGKITVAHSLQGTPGAHGEDKTFAEFGGTVELQGYTTDNAGHIIAYPTYKLTLPRGSYEETDNNGANVLTSLSFDSAAGALTGSKTNIAELKMTGYSAIENNEAISAEDTLKLAVGKLQSQIITNNSDINDRIDTEVNTLNGTIEKKIGEVNKTIEDTASGLNGTIEQVNTNLTSAIEQVNTDLTSAIGKVNTDLTSAIGQVNTDLTGAISTVENNLNNEINTNRNNAIAEAVDLIWADLKNHFNLVLNEPELNIIMTENEASVTLIAMNINPVEGDVYTTSWENGTIEVTEVGEYSCTLTRVHNGFESSVTKSIKVETIPTPPAPEPEPEPEEPVE